ncbi:MAG: GTPase Era [candidate division WOR-3 bacterium]|nr:GTPase Era [candidate division WOR-3 bacterium]MCX7948280.1 GTPase Era [candidate division WOR-3 bacterium]MDW8150959.1 GTPase Era [candidate division WOR-3 bacterium]
MKGGYIAIIGRPNVGKSSLLNVLVNEKLSAVSPKPQTTRFNLYGILNYEDAQFIFIDTPGIIKKVHDKLDKAILDEIKNAIFDADVLVLLVEPKLPDEEDLKIIELLKATKKPTILAINKIDLIKDKRILLPIMENYSKLFEFKEIIPISVLMRDGIDILLEQLRKYLPNLEAPYYDEDIITTKPLRQIVADIIREKVYLLYKDEIPYATAVKVEEYIDPEEHPEEKRDKVYIRAIIYVEKDSQKGIIIGEGGKKIKELGTKARKEIERLINKPVYLELWVKVREHWRRDESFIKSLNSI